MTVHELPQVTAQFGAPGKSSRRDSRTAARLFGSRRASQQTSDVDGRDRFQCLRPVAAQAADGNVDTGDVALSISL